MLCMAAKSIEGTKDKISDQFDLKKRVDYAQKLPCSDEIEKEYMKWEQGQEETEKKRLYIYRRTGKLALTWGWFMELLQKKYKCDVGDIEEKILGMSSEILRKYMEENRDVYEKLLTTIVFSIFIYPSKKNENRFNKEQRRMLRRIFQIFPWMTEDIGEYPDIISKMQLLKNIPYDLGVYFMKKWKADGDKEQEIGEFIRQSEFVEIEFVKINKESACKEKSDFIDEYIQENILWQESYAYQLINKRGDNGQIEKLSKKGINVLEIFFKYKNMEKDWRFFYDCESVRRFLMKQKDKKSKLSAEAFDLFLEQRGGNDKEKLTMILEHCQIEIADISKVYTFQGFICILASEEEIVRYYREKLLPKEILHKLIDWLRRIEQIEKIPLLLQWMYGEEED